MRKLIKTSCAIALSSSLLVSACATQPQRFETMSEEELFAYNLGVEELDRVHCVESAPTGSYIKRRTCLKLRDMNRLRVLSIPSSSSSVGFQ